MHTLPLSSSASLVLVTDGVTEARDQPGAFHDPGVGLSAQVFTDPDTLVQDVVAWTGGARQDGMALLVLTDGNPDPGDTRGGDTGHDGTPQLSAGD